jgi:hypothetical protein
MVEAVGGEVERVGGDDGVLVVVGFVGGERGRNVLVVMVVVGLVVVVGTEELVEEAIVVDLGGCFFFFEVVDGCERECEVDEANMMV